MNQFKRAQVILLEVSNNNFPNNTIIKYNYSFGEEYAKLCYENCAIRTMHNYQHLYIISDDEIKEDDYILTFTHIYGYNVHQIKEIHKGTYVSVKNELLPKEFIKGKIIATTDKSLTIKHNCDCGAIIYEGCSQCLEILPQPSQQFIEKYIEGYNKGEIITDILVEMEIDEEIAGYEHSYLKVNPKDNLININLIN